MEKRPVLHCCRWLVLLSFLLVGCGYHFRADGEPVGIQLESLAIPLISSTSSEIGFEADFTKMIRQEFISNGRVPLVTEEKAQAVLVGKVQEIRAEPLAYRSQDVAVGSTRPPLKSLSPGGFG